MQDPANIGRGAGQLVALVFLLIGVLKCHSISKRPTTNKKCAFGLMFLLIGWMVGSATIAGEAFAPELMNHLRALVPGARMALFVTACVFAILGLREMSQNKDLYTQGKKQAVWTLVLAGLIGIPSSLDLYSGAFVPSTMKSAQPADGKAQFKTFNFEYKIPDKSWAAVDAKKVNTNAVFAMMHGKPWGLFLIIGENPGVETELTLDALVENIKGPIEASSTSFRLISEKEIKLNGMTGKVLELEFERNNIRYFGLQTIFLHHGSIYQLVARSNARDQDFVRKESTRLFDAFRLLDTNSIAHVQYPKVQEHFESAFGYKVDLKGDGWHQWSAKGRNDISGEFAMLCKQTGALMVTPLPLDDTNASWDAIVSAALGRMTIEANDEKLVPLPNPAGSGATNALFSYERVADNNLFAYRLFITRNEHCAYLVAAWHTKGDMPDHFLEDAVGQVTFTPEAQIKLPAVSTWSRHRRETQGLFFNDIGVFYVNESAYEKAQTYLRLARNFDPKNKVFAENFVETCTRLNQCDKGLTALDEAKELYPENQWHVERAYLLLKAERKDEALKEFEAAFKDKYQNDDYFVHYLNLLMDRDDLDDGLKRVEQYLKLKDSPRMRIWQTSFLRAKGELDKSAAILQEQRKKYPSNKELTFALWETYHKAERDSEALELCEELLKRGIDSGHVYTDKGRSELALKHYREAKTSFEIALKKDPTDTEIKDFLDHVSGILGEGDNSSIKTVIAAVPVPDVFLKNPSVDTAATNNEYAAHYVKTIDAVSFEKGKEQKLTQSATVKVHNAAGVTQFSSVEFSFDPLNEEVFVNELTVKDKDGKTVWVGNASDYYVLDSGGSMATQNKTLHVPVSGLQPGFTIDWTVTRRSFGKAKTFDYTHRTFSRYFPVTKGTVLLRGDTAAVKWQTSSNVVQTKIDGVLAWQIDAPTTYLYEPLQTSSTTYLPAVCMVDSGATWTDEATNYLKRIEAKLILDSTTRSVAEKQVAGSTNIAEKVTRLAQFVQTNLTYKAIEFGHRACIPNASDKVIANRYGDCKDHALLLHQLLQAVGIDSHLALVNSADPIKKDLPTIDQFDHMILYVPGLDSGVFIDCTAKSLDAFTAALADTPDTLALVLDPANPGFKKIPMYPDNASSTEIERELSVENNADAVVHEKIAMTDYNASYFRGLLKDEEPARWKNTIQREYSDLNRAILVESLKVENLNDFRKPLIFDVTTREKDAFRDVSGSLSGKIPVSWELLYVTHDPSEKRETPFQIRVTQLVRSSTKITAPTGYRLRIAPTMKQESVSEFVQCHTKAEVVSSQTTKWQYEFLRPVNIYPASAYAGYEQTLNKATQLLQPDFVFEKAKE